MAVPTYMYRSFPRARDLARERLERRHFGLGHRREQGREVE